MVLARPAAAQQFQPTVVFDMGGKFDKSFNEAAYNGAERFKRDSGVAYLEFEIEWCAKLLPQGLGESELRDAVAQAVAALPQKDPKMAGRVVGAIKKQFGDRADAQLVKKIADELLSG